MQIAHIWQQITYFRCNYQHKIVCLTMINIRYCSRSSGSLLQMRFVIKLRPVRQPDENSIFDHEIIAN